MEKHVDDTKSTKVDDIAYMSLFIFCILFVCYLIVLAVDPLAKGVKPIPLLQGALFLWFLGVTLAKVKQHELRKDKDYDLSTLGCVIVLVFLLFGFF
jgi:hypothetical protein